MTAISYHDDLKEVQGDPMLAALLGADARAPFDRIAWWRNLAETCAIVPVIAVARDGAHRAVLAFTREGRALRALANWYSFRVAPLASAGADRSALFGALARDLQGEAPRLTLAPLPDEHGETELLAAAFRKAGWAVFLERCDVNHVLPVAGRSYAEFLAGRPGQVRTTLKRKAGKVRVVLSSAFDPALWDAYEAVYARSWKPAEGSPDFLRRFAQEEAAAERLRLGIAYSGDDPVAAQMWTVEAGTAFIHKLAYVESAKPLSPGTTLSAALFEQVIDRDRVELIDFGTGDDGYKRDWMEQVRPRYRLTAYRPGWPGNWPAMGKALLRRVVSHPRAG